MTINGKEIKTIRPMTDSEKIEYFNNYNISDKQVFCIEFSDNSIIYPKFDCVQCMENSKCLFTLAYQIP
jgi:hypothetical protein